ncbi:MAG: hypothetical protein KKD29_00525 [Candidatus Omnitrophica bacterium]|nr:hypothetical protein [Candidatus Omnitrophota bacterium]MBU4488125.1 hypothetical protein [Candidatus Omnitrophota bacterium]MCG2704959.1 hypothetical protein [Candidatus Omnitrophota bacterium]
MKHFIFFTLFIILSIFPSCIFADTIILTGGNEIKGLIVDEYVDRVVISTFEGEKTFLRKDVKSLRYEDTETRLLKLGNDAVGRTNYKAAAYYYRAVLKLNPNSIQARDGEIAAVRKELGSGTEIAKEEVELMTALEEPALSAGKDASSYEKNVRDLLGLRIKKSDAANKYYIYNVLSESPAADCGILKKDILSAVWNENVQYMTYEEMIKKLSGPEFSMAKLSIEREVSFPDPKRIKLDIGLKEEGYFIKDVSGVRGAEEILIKPGDWLLEINSVSTRYIPKDEIGTLLSNSKAPLTLLIKRDLYITREKGE